MARGERGGRSSRGARSDQPCRHWLQTGHCRFGTGCKYSHDVHPSPGGAAERSKHRESPQDTSEQQEAKENYNSWKRLIKVSPKLNDIKTIELLWTDALAILNGDDRDWKQMLPRDLDDDNYRGREHMQALLSMEVGSYGHGTFVKLAHPFLSVITHPALLDCLSVDTAVGSLYNYINGTNGSRVVPFLQRLNACLVEEHLNPTLPKSRQVLEKILIAISTVLRELLRREPRATFHDDLSALVDSIDTSSVAIDLEKSIVTFQIVQNGIRELRGIIGRAKGLLRDEQEPPPTGGVSTSLVTSTYPREMEMPRDRHDNDKTDMTEIQILPSEDEIRCDHAPFLPSTDPNQPHFLTNQIERHLDTHFRLYRHDCFGEVSEALGRAIFAIENDPAMLENTDLTLATITAKLVTSLERDQGMLVRLSVPNGLGLLAEFPDVLLATFVPILENLQAMQRLSRLPLSQWILPDRILSQADVPNILKIPPPLYARGTSISFSLNPVLRDSTAEFSVKHSLLTDPSGDLETLERQSQLDRGQCEALLAALTREFALVQGPSGTGKSYVGVQLMRVLQAELGPVIVACYTNHALDRFLQHLIEVGVSKIIRIGGRSRSTVLEGKNLRVVSHGESKTKSEGWHVAMIYKALEQQEITIKKTLATLHKIHKQPDWASLKHHLARSHRLIHAKFLRVDEDDFTIVGREPFNVWRTQDTPVISEHPQTANLPLVSVEDILLQARQSVHSVSSENRKRLVEHWTREIQDNAIDDLFESVKAADRLRRQLTDVHDEVDRRVLETADVIGVTTTGLARRIAALQRVKCKVVICEEAGEVMEPHMLSVLLPSVEHFIQIGDHQQLRPQINNYRLSLESQQGALYQLDRS
ncbi:MAG: hypothetical protein Q9201_000436 [Fulgogasparrea decipioides]